MLASKMTLEESKSFTSMLSKLLNFFYNEKIYSGVSGMTRSTEIVNVAVILLIEKALTWWRSVL